MKPKTGMTVSLNNLRFHAHHGLYEEEKITGNSFVVDCHVRLPAPDKIIDRLDETVNYQIIFDLIKSHMEVATPLLETLCMNIEKDIHSRFPQVQSITVRIQKLHPPIPGFDGTSSVTWHKEYEAS